MSTVATIDGIALPVWFDGEHGCVRIGGVGVWRDDVEELANLLRVAANLTPEQVPRTQPVGKVGGGVWVVRHPYHVGLREGEDWRRHNGPTMQTEDAEALAEAVLAAAQ